MSWKKREEKQNNWICLYESLKKLTSTVKCNRGVKFCKFAQFQFISAVWTNILIFSLTVELITTDSNFKADTYYTLTIEVVKDQSFFLINRQKLNLITTINYTVNVKLVITHSQFKLPNNRINLNRACQFSNTFF